MAVSMNIDDEWENFISSGYSDDISSDDNPDDNLDDNYY